MKNNNALKACTPLTVYKHYFKSPIAMDCVNDHSLYSYYKAGDKEAEKSVNRSLEECLRNFSDWMCQNRLHMNNDKTELITVGSLYQLSKCNSDELDVCGYPVEKSP